MKKLRLLIAGVLLLSATSMFALASYVELSLGGGWSSLGYGLTNQSQPGLSVGQKGSYGLDAHIGYGLLFNRYVGVGIGVDFARYGATAAISGQAVWPGVIDTDGELYDHRVQVNRWNDYQSLYMVEVPLSLYLHLPVSERAALFGQLGVKACLPVMSGGKYSGQISHTGFYEPWMMTIDNVPGHGFYTSTMEADYTMKTKMTMAAFAKIGIEGPVDEERRVWLFGAIYGTYHFMPAFDTANAGTAIGWKNDTQDQSLLQAHYFMNDYTPLFNTDMAVGKPKPLAIGAEIGIRFRIPHPKRHDCRCYRW